MIRAAREFDWREAIDALLCSWRAVAAGVILVAVVAVLMGL